MLKVNDRVIILGKTILRGLDNPRCRWKVRDVAYINKIKISGNIFLKPTIAHKKSSWGAFHKRDLKLINTEQDRLTWKYKKC